MDAFGGGREAGKQIVFKKKTETEVFLDNSKKN